jgi:hypothetical protein
MNSSDESSALLRAGTQIEMEFRFGVSFNSLAENRATQEV